MAELKDVFEIVTRQTEPDPDSWNQQERRQRRTVRRRKAGAIALAAALSIAGAIFVIRSLSDEGTTTPAITPPPVAETSMDLSILDPQTGAVESLVTAGAGGETEGELSPDGASLVFVRDYAVYVMSADGSDRRQLVGSANFGFGPMPTWSPDGTQIAFVQNEDIYVMNADGSDPHRLAGTRTPDANPDWSPDGMQIVFNSGDSIATSDQAEIWVVSVGDGRMTQLTRNDVFESYPTWSPDGQTIAFERWSRPDASSLEHASLWLMRADGSDQRRLVKLGGFENPTYPTWSPDSREIAFVVSISGGNPESGTLAIVTIDDGVTRTLLDGVSYPNWTTEGILVGQGS